MLTTLAPGQHEVIVRMGGVSGNRRKPVVTRFYVMDCSEEIN